MANLRRIEPVNTKSADILQKKEFALVGISPFNSYFSSDRIFEILKSVNNIFSDYSIFIPDKISQFTLKALGYDEKRISYKIRKQDNHLINRAKKALDKLNDLSENKKHNHDKIIYLTDMNNTQAYIDSYYQCQNLMQNDIKFKQGCIRTSSWVLASYENNNRLTNIADKNIAVQYFLKELPAFLAAPAILNVNTCMFIYISIPYFLQEIYDNYNLASPGAGFAVYKES